MPKTAENILAEQFEQDRESWKPDHAEVMACYRLSDHLEFGLRHFRGVRAEDELWSSMVQMGKTPFDSKVAKYFREKYEWWIRPCDELLRRIDNFEKTGHKVEGASEFREARLLTLTILSTPIDAIVGAMERIAKGEYEVI
jgi:hypothetical protein